MNLKNRHFLTLLDFTPEEIEYLLDLSAQLKQQKKLGIPHKMHEGKSVALIFEKTSTRTRCAFEVAAADLGMHPVYLDPSASQIGKKESIADTARVLAGMFDGIEYRGFSQEVVEDLAKYSNVPVWNGLTDMFHPTVSTLFSHELPATDIVPHTGYIDFLDIQAEQSNSEIKEAFRWSNAYLWLLDALAHNVGCLYFGAATQLLHNALVQDPRPYRRDVKLYLSNLLAWVVALDMDEIVIDRPNYSQRIMLKSMKEDN